MKRNLFTMLALFAGITMALAEDVHVTVHGSAPANVKEVGFYNLNTGKPLATVPVADGKFTYSNTLDENTIVVIGAKDYDKNCAFVCDGATVYANMTDGSVMGTRLSNKLNAFCKEMETYQETFKRITEALNTLKDTAKLSQMKQVKVSTRKMWRKEVIKTIEDNKDNILPAAILNIADDALTYDDMNKYANTNDVYTSHPLMASIKAYLASVKNIIGQPVKDFAITDANGAKHKLSEFIGNGKYTLVDFWASWCVPCMKEMPYVKKCYDAYHAKGFNVVGISLDSQMEAWQKAIKTKGLSWQQFCDFTVWKNEGVELYGIQGIPYNFLCDSTGKIIEVELRGDKLTDKIDELFGE